MPLSSFLNASVPTQLRGLAWLSLSDVGQVGRGTVIGDTGGGGTTAWTYSGTISCRIDPLNGRSRLTGGQIDERSTHVVTAQLGATVSASDRFAIAGRGTFEVTATHERTGRETLVFEVLKVS